MDLIQRRQEQALAGVGLCAVTLLSAAILGIALTQLDANVTPLGNRAKMAPISRDAALARLAALSEAAR